jgi:hypothetical protein
MSRQTEHPAAGRPGTSISVGQAWTGWAQLVAHPSAPLGAGGPGNFSSPVPLNADAGSDLPSPWQPGPLGIDPPAIPTDTPTPANAPPATNPRSLGVVKQVQNEFADYKIEAEIVADGSGGVTTGANTSFTRVASNSPTYEAVNGKITKFSGKFTFKGTITIQTKYASDSNPSTLSCYGRGTTDADVKNRDITLGFHESCHRADYQAFLAANALPDPPAMSIGMNASDYDKAAAAFSAAITKYYKDMEADSIKNTDEVGFTLSKSNKSGKCYEHILP